MAGNQPLPTYSHSSNDMGAAPPSASLAESPTPSLATQPTFKSVAAELQEFPAFRNFTTQLKDYLFSDCPEAQRDHILGLLLDSAEAVVTSGLSSKIELSTFKSCLLKAYRGVWTTSHSEFGYAHIDKLHACFYSLALSSASACQAELFTLLCDYVRPTPMPQPTPASSAPIQAPSVCLTQRDLSDKIALDALKQIGLTSITHLRQAGSILWHLRCRLPDIECRPRLLAAMLLQIFSEVSLAICAALPRYHTVPANEIPCADLQAQLDSWIKDHIRPHIPDSVLPYMAETFDFFDAFTTEHPASTFNRLANHEDMRSWAMRLFNLTDEKIRILRTIERIDPAYRAKVREGLAKGLRTAREIATYLQDALRNEEPGEIYPNPTSWGHAIEEYPRCDTPMQVNAAKIKTPPTAESNSAAKKTRTDENKQDQDKADQKNTQNQQRPSSNGTLMKTVSCQRCFKKNHDAANCLAKLTIAANQCSRCRKNHATDQCPATAIPDCVRCGDNTHLLYCCPMTIAKATILLGIGAPAEYPPVMRRYVLEKNDQARKVNAISAFATSAQLSTDTDEDPLASTKQLFDGLDIDISDLPQPLDFPSLIEVNTLHSNAAFLCPAAIAQRIDGPLSSPLEYTSVAFGNSSDASLFHSTQGLMDSGANIVMTPTRVVRQLIAKKIINAADIYTVRGCQLIMADNRPVSCTTIIVVQISSCDKTYRAGVFVVDELPYDLIIGLPGLSQLFNHRGFATKVANQMQKQLTASACDAADVTKTAPRVPVSPDNQAEHTEGRAPWISEIPIGEKRALQINFPLMQDAAVEPHVSPPRRMSKNEEYVAWVLTKHMQQQGKLEEVSSSQADVVLPVVLVDKRASDESRPPTISDGNEEEILARYRFCIDSRATNQLELREMNGKWVYIAPKQSALSASPAHSPYQYQTGGYELLSRMPASAQFFARVDIKNAFYGVYLHPDLRRLFCFEVFDFDTRRPVIYRMKVLPQGWRWSPLFFRKISQFLLDKLRARLNIDFPDLSQESLYLCFLQDDLVIAGNALELVSHSQSLLMEILTSYSFEVNRDKSKPPSTRLEFCGYLISNGLVTPTATRNSVTHAFAESAWKQYLSLKPQARVKWFYSIAGTFHFSRAFLDADCALNLRVVYDHLKILNHDPLAQIDPNLVKTALFELVTFLNEGLPPSILFHFTKVYASILVTDANIKAWAAQLFYLVDVPRDNPQLLSVLPDLKDLTKRLTSCTGFPAIAVPDEAILVPVRMAADVFTPREQITSSTTRERYAQLAAVDELYQLFQGPVVLINDNQNSIKQWHEVDRLFSGRKADQFGRFQQHVHFSAWMPREEGLPCLADELARLRESLVEINAKHTTHSIGEAVNAVQAPAPQPNDMQNQPHDPIEIIPLLPPVPVPGDNHATTPHFNNLTEQFHDHYLTDRSQEHNKANMADICRHLLVPDENVDPTVRSAAVRFRLLHNLVVWDYRGTNRLYVPRFPVIGALAGNEAVSSHTYLVMLAHFGHGAHASRARMEAELKRSFWWPTLEHDVRHFVNACTVCRELKATRSLYRGDLGSPVHEARRPFDIWQMDFAEAPDQQGYFLMFICAFSGYVIARKCASSTHHFVLDMLWEQIILTYGRPIRIHSDQGTHFTAQAVQERARLWGILLTFGPTSHSRAQGLVEKAIGDVKTAYLSAKETHEGIAPARALTIAVWHHNTHMHSRLGFTPFEIVHGFHPRSYLDLHVPPEFERHLGEREQELREIIPALVRLRREDAHAEYQERYLASSRPSNIKPGDLVFQHIPRPIPGGHKLISKGPFYAVRQASRTTWILSADVWTPERIWTDQDRVSPQPVPELQLRRQGEVGEHAGRQYLPPSAPAALTRRNHLDEYHTLNSHPVPRYPVRTARGGRGTQNL